MDMQAVVGVGQCCPCCPHCHTMRCRIAEQKIVVGTANKQRGSEKTKKKNDRNKRESDKINV